MIEICLKENCTGCMACLNVCKHEAITTYCNDEGFEYPKIDQDKCVDCGMCRKVCTVNNICSGNDPKKIFSGWSPEEAVRLGSSSGGAFTEIARPILESGGVVFGCALNDKLVAEHTWVDNLDDLQRNLSGSKYVQSKIGYSYRQVKSFLKEGRKVLFSGTPCQIAGLRNYLRIDYTNLFTVDLICHGVPSPMLFEDYKTYMEYKLQAKLTDVKFRCKKFSWIFFNMHLKAHTENRREKEYTGCYYEDPYLRGFLRDYFLRPSCHHCQYATTSRVGDFTIADWWGYKKYLPIDKGFRYKGVSLLLVNTEKAVEHLGNMNMCLRERTLEEAKRTNISLSRAFPMPSARSEFWKDYHAMPFHTLIKKYMRPERVAFDKYILQHCLNTDCLVRLLSLTTLPKRSVRKIYKIVRGKTRIIMSILTKVRRKLKNISYYVYVRRQSNRLAQQIATRGDRVLYLFCAPTHSNLGDQAQLMCWLRLFREWYPQHEIILVPTHYRQFKTIRNIHEGMNVGDLIFVHSGYLMFDPHPELPFILDIVRALYDCPIVILPQTVNLMGEWYRQVVSRSLNMHPNLTLLCRDEVSLDKARQLFPNLNLMAVPDVVTTLIGDKDFQYSDIKKDGVMVCVRNDLEKFYTDEQIHSFVSRFKGLRTLICDTTIKADIWEWNEHREELIRKMLRKMAEYQVVITDRFHGTIFAQVVNTPTIVISSTDHKLSSGVKWFPQELFGKNITFASSLDDAYEKAQKFLSRGGKTFVNPTYFKERYYAKPLQ